MMSWTEYFDCGFVIVNESHKQFFQDIVSFYFSNQDNLIKVQNTFHVGTDQTPVNILTHKHNIELKLLPYEFNMNDIQKKSCWVMIYYLLKLVGFISIIARYQTTKKIG